ncbi:MAG: hypothetical protein JXR83_14750 [Deltaproteobacteria bacterium]|nr:hypothetical protein [Deltaproteobacteria bacterium]
MRCTIIYLAYAASGALGLVPAAACGPTTRYCYGDAQCPPGYQCTPRGVCAPGDASAIGDGGLDLDAGTGVDGAGDDGGSGHDRLPRDRGTLADGGQPLCPAWDGVIEQSEVDYGAGLTGHYRTIDPAQPANVSLVPQTIDGGSLWDFSAAVPGETSIAVETFDPAGTWFAADFPEATYTALLEDGGDLLGVFRVGVDVLEMVGVVSLAEGDTELFYDPPVVLFRYPFRVGDRWSTESLVSGVYGRLAAGFYETYTFEVRAAGKVKVPAGTFDVLEVHLLRLVEVPTLNPYYWITTTAIKYLFVAQCYGTVATVGSRDDEEQDPFTVAREYKRLGF